MHWKDVQFPIKLRKWSRKGKSRRGYRGKVSGESRNKGKRIQRQVKLWKGKKPDKILRIAIAKLIGIDWCEYMRYLGLLRAYNSDHCNTVLQIHHNHILNEVAHFCPFETYYFINGIKCSNVHWSCACIHWK